MNLLRKRNGFIFLFAISTGSERVDLEFCLPELEFDKLDILAEF